MAYIEALEQSRLAIAVKLQCQHMTVCIGSKRLLRMSISSLSLTLLAGTHFGEVLVIT